MIKLVYSVLCCFCSFQLYAACKLCNGACQYSKNDNPTKMFEKSKIIAVAGYKFGHIVEAEKQETWLILKKPYAGIFDKVKLSVNKDNRLYGMRLLCTDKLNLAQKIDKRNKFVNYMMLRFHLNDEHNLVKSIERWNVNSPFNCYFKDEMLYVAIGLQTSELFADIIRNDIKENRKIQIEK